MTITALIALVALPTTPALAQDSVDGKDTPLIADSNVELKTVAAVALAPYESLIKDINYLGSLGGKPELGQMIEGGLAFFTQGKGPEALDKTKPWGFITQTDGMAILPVVCLPVKNADDLIGVAVAYGAELSDGEDGVKVLTLNEQPIYVKAANGWAFVGQNPAALAKVPKDPQAAFSKMLGDYDVAVKIAVKNVPDVYLQFAQQAMQSGMDQQLNRTENETDEEYESRRKLAEAQMQQMVQMINEIDSVSIGWAVDAEKQNTFVDFMYLVKPDSKLDRQIDSYKDATTNFAGFYQQDSAATATLSMKADPKLIAEDIDQLNAGMAQMRAQFNKAVDESENIEDAEARDTIKAAAGDLFDALEATVKSGRADFGGSLQFASEEMTIVAGAHIKDPEKVEAGLRKIEEAAKKNENSKFPGVEWNAAEHAGVKFHTIKFPVPEHLDAPRKYLGEEANIAVGIGNEAVYIAVGKDNLEAVSKAIDASASSPEKPVPPFEVAVSVTPFIELAASEAEDEGQRKIMTKVVELLQTEAAGRDHVRIVGKVVPHGLRYRIEAEEGVLRGIGKATAEAQRQMMEAAQQPAAAQ
jgi:hypothetical protein